MGATVPHQCVLITGGAGFVGGAIVDALIEQHPDWRIIVTDIKPASIFLDSRPQVQYETLNVLDLEAAKAVLKSTGATSIIHTAGIVPGGIARYGRDPKVVAATFGLNVNGTRNMLDAARACNVRYFVHTSSCTTITDDLSTDYPNFDETTPIPRSSLIYGESKAVGERLALAANDAPNLLVTALRPSTILGPGDYQLVPAIQACIARRETPFVIGDGNNLYDFTYVSNVADAHVLALENLLGLLPGRSSCAGHAILISNDQPITFRDFCLAIWAQWDHVPPFEVPVPRRVATVAGALAEFWAKFVPGPDTFCRGSVKDAYGVRYCSQAKAKEYLGYEPRVPLWDGVRMACDALKVRLGKDAVLAEVGRKFD